MSSNNYQNNQPKGAGRPNPYDPNKIKEDLMKAPLIEMEFAGPVWKTTCSKFGAGVVDMLRGIGIKSAIYCHVFPEINRGGGIVTNIYTVIAFDAANNGQGDDIWINGAGGKNGNVPLITDWKPQKTASGKFGVSKKWKDTFYPLAAHFDDKGNIVINEPSAEQIKQDRRFRNFAYLEVDFFALMALALQIEDGEPYDFMVDFDASKNRNHGQEDCLMTVTKFVGRRKSNVSKYRDFDQSVMVSGIENMFGGGNNGGRRNR